MKIITVSTVCRIYTLMSACMILLALAVTGCATPTGDTAAKLAVQYATMRLIRESSTITTPLVLERIAQVQLVLDGETVQPIQAIAGEIIASSQRLTPDEQVLVQLLVQQVLASMGDLNLLDEAQRLRTGEVLQWVKEGAILANDRPPV